MDVQRLIEIRKQAEEAVKDMPDGPLKTKAFEMIFNSLRADAMAPARKKRPKVAKKPKTAAKARAPRKEGPKARIKQLKDEGFFDEPRYVQEVVTHLEEAKGFHHTNKEVGARLLDLVREQVLRRKKDDKAVYQYTNW